MAKSQYLVTARKYRPQRFSDLVAQTHVAQALVNALKLDRIAHAYLFTGPRGVGKTTAARILAKAINCTGHQDGEVEPCLDCPSCDDFETQRSLSIFEIDAASNNKVEDIRELRENVQIPPQGGHKKVYIVDEVHMLSNAAFNALLKTLEEPPPHVLFIFATTEPHKVLPTILSRCQRFDFRCIPTGKIVTHLVAICKSEGVTADDDALHLIAHKGDGSLRDALSVFDQAVALCGSDLKYSTLTDALRVVDVDLYFEATQYMANRATGSILSLAERIMSDGYDVGEFLDGLAEHTRNLLVTSSLGTNALIDVSKNLRERYAETAKNFSETTLLRLLMVMDETQSKLPTSTSPRLALELALVKMTRMADSVDLSEALKQVRQLEQTADGSPQQIRQPSVNTRNQPTPVQPPPPPKNTPVAPPIIQQPQQKKPNSATIAIGGEPALSQRRKRPATQTRTGQSETSAQNQITQNQAEKTTRRQASLQKSWNHVLEVVDKQTDVQGGCLLQNSKVLRIHDQVLEIAVHSEIVIKFTKDQALRNLIEKTMQNMPGLQTLPVKFIARPDLFPEQKVNLNAEFQNLKEKNPALRLIDSTFGLRLVNPLTS